MTTTGREFRSIRLPEHTKIVDRQVGYAMSAAPLLQLLKVDVPLSSWPPELRLEVIMMIDRWLSVDAAVAGRRHLRLVYGGEA